MAKPVYRRTARGRKAWDTQSRAVSLEHRRVLGHITGEVDCDILRARVGRYSEAELSELLLELESLGLVESLGEERAELDFTGGFNIAEIRRAHEEISKAHEAAQDDLDFTGSFRIADLRPGQK